MNLVHDLLDQQLVDRKGEPCGRVDGLVLETRDDGPPRFTWIETGAATRARRLGRWAVWLAARFKRREHAAVRIPSSALLKSGLKVQVDIDARESGLQAAEQWVEDKIIGRIPGA